MNINKIICVFLATATTAFCSCGAIGNGGEDSSTPAETVTTSRQYVQTTKTMSKAVTADANDEDEEGYTTTQEVTGSLENTYTEPDTPDEDILATFSTTTTLYTIPAGAEIKTTASESKATSSSDSSTATENTTAKTTTVTTTATTAFNADALYNPADGDKLSGKVKYHVVSDTTYLNLRFGPSKKYSVQLKIPDGEYVYGTAETSNPDNSSEKWVFVSYNGTSGWVMRDLLEKAE